MGTLPSDSELARMSRRQLDRVAADCRTDAEREQLADALLRINNAWLTGAHSELSDTRRARRMRRERSAEVLTERAGLVLIAPPPDLTPAIRRAQRAALAPLDCAIWSHYEAGATQAQIAEALGRSQGCIAQRLSRAREKIAALVDRDPLVLFCESMKRARCRIPLRDMTPLPSEVQEARAVLESRGFETWILPAIPGRVFLIEDPSVIREPGDITQLPSLTFRQLIAKAQELSNE